MDPAKKATLLKRLLFGGIAIGTIAGAVGYEFSHDSEIPTRTLILILGLLAQWELVQMIWPHLVQRVPGLRGVIFLTIGISFVLHVCAYALARHEWSSWNLAAFALPAYFLMASLVEIVRGTINARFFFSPTALAFYVTVPIVSLHQIRTDPQLGGLSGILFLVAIAKIGDIAAYFVGSFAGKRKLAPAISPNKTWEGAIASAVFAMGLSAFLQSQGWAAGFAMGQALLAGLVINIAAQISDLSKSILKRACGVKDSGSYFSVMGGALDMIDSLIFAAPAYVALRLLWA